MFCERCGSRINDDQQFCSECGAKIDAAPNEQTPSEQTFTGQISNPQQTAYNQPVQQMYAQPSVQYTNVPNNKSKNSKFTIITSIIVVLVVIIVGAVCLFTLNKKGNNAANNRNNVVSEAGNQQNNVVSEAGKKYKKVLENIKQTESSSSDGMSYYYALWDINNDDIPDLVIASSRNSDVTRMLDAKSGVNIVSYDGKKLTKSEKLTSSSDSYATLYFNKNHDGIVTLAPVGSDATSDGDMPWAKTTYRLNKHHKFTTSSETVEHPLGSDGVVHGSDELSKVVMPPFTSVSDMRGVDALVNNEKNSQKVREHNINVQDWIEKGYQVYTGTVKTLSKEDAKNLPGADKDDSDGSQDNYDDNARFTVLVLDNPSSVTVANGFMDCALRPTITFGNKVAVLISYSNGETDNNFKQYEGKKITIATKPNYIMYHNGDLPFGQPAVDTDDIHVIK